MRGRNVQGVTAWAGFLVFRSLQSPAEALLGNTARRKIFRESLPSPLSCCLHVGGREPCGCLEWLSGVRTWEMVPLLGLCHGSFLPEATPGPGPICSQPHLLLSPHRAGVPQLSQPSFSDTSGPCERFLIISFLLSLFPVTQDLVRAIHHSSAHLKQDTRWNQNTL